MDKYVVQVGGQHKNRPAGRLHFQLLVVRRFNHSLGERWAASTQPLCSIEMKYIGLNLPVQEGVSVDLAL